MNITSPPVSKHVPPIARTAAGSTAKESKGAPPSGAQSASRSPAFVGNGSHVIVDINQSESDFNNKIYWSDDNFKTKHYLGIDNQSGTYDLGSIGKGKSLQFGIDNGHGSFFQTGGGSANPDGMDHTQVRQNSNGSTTVGFEDTVGGGDRDYNDAMISVRNAAAAAPTGKIESKAPNQVSPTPAPRPAVTKVAEKAPETKTSALVPTGVAKNAAATHAPASMAPPKVSAPVDTRAVSGPTKTASSDNRSGLGDGTNPGQGVGKTNSPNTGTLNPGGTKASDTSASSAAKAATSLYHTVAAFVPNKSIVPVPKKTAVTGVVKH